MVERLSAANGVLDRFKDPSWLSWAEPARLMPATQERVRRQLEERERRQKAAAEVKQLAADRRRDEEAQKKREAGKKTAGGSSKPGRGAEGVESERVGGGLQRFGIGRDSGASGEGDKVGSGEARGQRSVGRDEEGAGARGMHPGKSHRCSCFDITDDYDRKTTAIDARSHPESSGAIAGRTT